MSGFPSPVEDLDNETFWKFVADGEVRFQKCRVDNQFWYPIGPVCPRCLQADYDWVPVSGTGTLSSWVIYHKRYFPGVATPYAVVNVDLPEGIRVLGNLIDYQPGLTLEPGLPVSLTITKDSATPLPQFILGTA